MRSWWLLALVAFVGCSFDSEAVLTIENSCESDATCSQGVCDENICIDDTGASVDVAIEVLHDSSDSQVMTPSSWAFAAEPASGRTSRDLLLPATRQVLGTVRWDGARVPATLRFVRKMDEAVAPLAPVPIEVDTLREAAGGDGPEGYDYTTVLVAGEIYDVAVLPSSDMVMAAAQEPAPAIRLLPPLYLLLSIADGDPSEPFRFDIAFPADLNDDCEGISGVGCRLTAQVLSRDGEVDRPEAGLQVRAIDEKGRVVSSIAETDENGDFEVRISDTAPAYLIRVTSSVEGNPFPAVSVEPKDVFTGDPMEEKRIFIPRLAPIQSTGEVRDMIGRAVPGATVRFLSTIIPVDPELGLPGSFSFSGSATTNEDGSFGMELLPGTYSITVTPPEDSENSWGILSADAELDEELTAIDTLVVPPQLNLGGTVATFGGEAGAGVTILAGARSGGDPGALNRSQEAVSDDLGDFAMSVDPGLYDMQVKVPAESGFAWFVEPDLLMSVNKGDLRKEYRLDPPIPIYGVIRTSEGEPLPNALVRGHLFKNSDGAAARPLQIAETVSGEDGSYRLLIAPRLGDE